MRVRDIMTAKVVSCRKDTDLASAARLMTENRFGSLPVVDEHGRVAGIITDRDIAMAAAARQRNASHIAVHEAMSEHVTTCLADENIDTALKKMEGRRVRRLPVLDRDGRLAGILSVDDIVLRGLEGPNGLQTTAFIEALQRLCSRPPLEPEFNFAETFVSGQVAVHRINGAAGECSSALFATCCRNYVEAGGRHPQLVSRRLACD